MSRRGEGGEYFDRIAWSTITAMTAPDMVMDAFIGRYVLPPNVPAAIFRHLTQQPVGRRNP